MSTTSDERREVAEQLREARPSTYYAEELVELIEDALSPAFPTETWREPTDVLVSLADLVDPTCEVADCGRQDGHTVCRGCSSCHGGWHEDVYDQPYAYCPRCGCRLVNGACHYCGARVVRDGE